MTDPNFIEANEKIEEYLAVLKMPGDEQEEWVGKYAYAHREDSEVLKKYNKLDFDFDVQYGESELPWSLADFAFRLRDELCRNSLSCDNYSRALHIVFRSFCKSQIGTIRQNMVPYNVWLESFITAIERIIAALIAKELNKRE